MDIIAMDNQTIIEPVSIRAVIEPIALSRLMPSKANVRRVNAGVGVSELADSIEALGLLQNLTVRKAKKGKYEVVAGSRRLAALNLLVKEGRLTEDAEIPCNIRDDNDTELSLAENVQREAMHIVDEILSYHQLAEDGMAADVIASRFGQSVITVRQRLKLANLSPKVLDELRSDAITIEQARALAISDSHEEQERVWFEAPSWNRDPRSLRSLLTQEHVRSTDRLARFVGLETYEAAGGGLVRDLFGEDSSTFLTDRALLTQLAVAELEKAAEALKSEGWAWVEPSLEASALYNSGMGRIYPQTRALTDEEETELSALAEAADALQMQIEGYEEGDPAIEAEEAKLEDIQQQMEDIQNAARSYDPQEIAVAGCIVAIDHYGTLQINRGYIKPEDREALTKLQRGDAEGAAADDGDSDEAPVAISEPEAGYSAALEEELTAIRTAALRVELANRPAIALAALLYPLVGRIFHSGYTTYEAAVEVQGQRRALAPSIKEPSEVRALAAWKAMQEAWGDTLPGQPADLWAWLLDQPTDKLLELLAFVTAANVNGVKAKHDQSRSRLANVEQLATAVGLDMAVYWTADATFLNRLSKTGIAEVLIEAGCAAQTRSIEKATKAEAVATAERQLVGKGWLPAVLRTDPAAE
jgi:ParB family chromosome partitioning protein